MTKILVRRFVVLGAAIVVFTGPADLALDPIVAVAKIAAEGHQSQGEQVREFKFVAQRGQTNHRDNADREPRKSRDALCCSRRRSRLPTETSTTPRSTSSGTSMERNVACSSFETLDPGQSQVSVVMPFAGVSAIHLPTIVSFRRRMRARDG
jgi:hypothetical protein